MISETQILHQNLERILRHMVKEIADLQFKVEGQDRELAVLRLQLDTLSPGMYFFENAC